MNRVLTASLTALIAVLLVSAKADASHQELALFDQGYGYYLSYQPEKAVESFHIFLNEFPQSSAKDAAMFWLGKSVATLHHYEEAKQIFLRLKHEMPDSPFIGYVDKELKTMGNQGAEKLPLTAFEKTDSDPEIHALKNDKAQTEKELSVVKEERDKLRLLLDEEKLKNQELKTRAESFDNELKDIFARLQTLRTNREEENAISPSLEQRESAVQVIQESRKAATVVANEKSVPNNVTKETEKELPKTVRSSNQNQKVHPVTQQTSLHTLELIASEETWVFVNIDNRESRERLLRPGSRIRWTAKNAFSLRIGNAGGTKVIFNGKEIGPLGGKGKVVKLRLPSFNLSTSQKKTSDVL